MADAPKPSQPTNLGVYDRPNPSAMSAVEVIALALSGLWLVGSVVFFMVLGVEGVFGQGMSGQGTFLMTILAIFVPVAVIWVAASAARSQRIIKEETRRLQASVDALRQTYVADAQGRGSLMPSVERKIEEIAAAAKQTEDAVASFTSQRNPPKPPPKPVDPQADDQPGLALGTPAEDLSPPLSHEDFIRALHFPETAQDKEGFAALRRALQDHRTAGLIRAAQDILTLMSQDGIYMDDLRPDRVKPELWRRFAAGERGRQIAALGGVHDRSSLALTSGRMRKDTIFRDTAHHFLRKFDQALITFSESASDAEIDALSQTRTARAFMLLGRVLGIFD